MKNLDDMYPEERIEVLSKRADPALLEVLNRRGMLHVLGMNSRELKTWMKSSARRESQAVRVCKLWQRVVDIDTHVLALYQRAADGGRPPTAEQIEALQQRTDAAYVKLAKIPGSGVFANHGKPGHWFEMSPEATAQMRKLREMRTATMRMH